MSIYHVSIYWLSQNLLLHPTDDITMVICPGIANHSEKQYIRTFVDYAQKNGYRCAVLNHLGALPNIELTSPRMFTYGKLGPRPSGVPLNLFFFFSVPTASVLLRLRLLYFSEFRVCAHVQELVRRTIVTAGHLRSYASQQQLSGALEPPGAGTTFLSSRLRGRS